MLHRRDAMIRLGQVGLGALTLPRLFEAEGKAAVQRQHATTSAPITSAKAGL